MAESIAHFAIKSIGLSRVNGRKPCTLMEAARHNLREIQAEKGATGRIDATRTRCNTILHGPGSAAEVQAQATALLAAAGVDPEKLRRDHCQAIEAVFSLPPDAAIHDRPAYFAQCLAWLANALTLPVLSAVVHLDEAAMHLHVLLLPLEGRAYVGSAPISRVSLKRLRENFFAKVAGPAGLKRSSAKYLGAAKQWAVAAVLRRCEALGLPAANGSLWPVLVAAISADPTPAMLALEIDGNTIRPSDKLTQAETKENPIGIASNPIGIAIAGAKHRTLSCVGFAASPPSNEPLRPLNTLADLWAVVGCKSQWRTPSADRLRIARAAQQSAIERHTRQAPAKSSSDTATAPYIAEEWIRVRDEYAHDLTAWG